MENDASEDEWKEKLSPEQYHILREKGTEAPFTGSLLHNDETGLYICAACGAKLFSSDSKFDSTTPGLVGWPSFSNVVKGGAVELEEDDSHGMKRTEVVCKNCGSHLGHLFDDPAAPSNQHYCINSAALSFTPRKSDNKND